MGKGNDSQFSGLSTFPYVTQRSTPYSRNGWDNHRVLQGKSHDFGIWSRLEEAKGLDPQASEFRATPIALTSREEWVKRVAVLQDYHKRTVQDRQGRLGWDRDAVHFK